MDPLTETPAPGDSAADPAAEGTSLGRSRRARPPRRWPAWLIPLASAAAVIAVAVSLVVVRDLPGARPGAGQASPAPGPVVPPRYEVMLDPAGGGTIIEPGGAQEVTVSGLTVYDTLTQQRLAQIRPPAKTEFTGIAGAADDRTFVVDAAVSPSAGAGHGTRAWFLLRLTPGGPHPVTLTSLRIDGPGTTATVTGLALSPDGRTTALLYWPNTAGSATAPAPATLRTYSVATGQMLHSWTAPGPGRNVGGGNGDNVAGLTWLANGREVAFTWPGQQPGQAVRTLDVTRPGRNLVADSHAVFTLPTAGVPCAQALLTPDGRTVLCGSKPQSTGLCNQSVLEFDTYSVATGKRDRVLYRYIGRCDVNGVAQLVWAGSGTEAIVQLAAVTGGQGGLIRTQVVGAVTPGRLSSLGIALTDTPYPPGAIAF